VNILLGRAKYSKIKHVVAYKHITLGNYGLGYPRESAQNIRSVTAVVLNISANIWKNSLLGIES
jgi:hypothetical protein